MIAMIQGALARTTTINLVKRNLIEVDLMQVTNGQASKVQLENVFNLAYLGNMYFGSTMQGTTGASFLYDTSFKGVAVTASNCTTCVFPYFDPALSTTFVGDATKTVNITI